MALRTSLCDRFGIEHPIAGFTPSEQVAAAISRAGGLGVLGAVRYNDADELEAALTWMDANTDGRPYGVDVVMPAKIPAEGTQIDLDQLIPASHREFVDQTLRRLGVPPLAADEDKRDGVLGWLHSVARAHVEVALEHPVALIANALGSPPDDVIEAAHDRGIAVAALAGKAEHAARHVSRGVDIVVAQGYEAGGHTGEIASMVLVPEVVDAVGPGVPVLAAGGIGSGQADRGRARPRRDRRLDGLVLADHAGVHARIRRCRTARRAARGDIVGHRAVADLQRQAGQAAQERVDQGVG